MPPEPQIFEPPPAAQAKIWGFYIAEAKKYDKALVESWKSDMEGMLIFAGLFSASLTAFLIKSYKNLNPDPGDVSIRLLAQISEQLSAAGSGKVVDITPPVPFTPSASALTCNALWFTSLGLSLTCALVATLLEQWARDFIHRSEIQSAPLIRARMFSFLYYGLKRFSMHTVVEVIPLLLYTSLFLFFAGLVAFLLPVNIVMAVLAGVMLVIVVGMYSALTVLPLGYLDSPYRTPLSGAFWHLFQALRAHWQHRQSARAAEVTPLPPTDETILEAVLRKATEVSEPRRKRDSQALVWTVKSLTDDELEAFVDAIPDVLSHSGSPYTDHFRHLINHPEVELFPRVTGLLYSAGSHLLPPEAAKRRRIIAYKALWRMTCLFVSDAPLQGFPLAAAPAEGPHAVNYELDRETLHFSLSTEAVIEWGALKSLRLHLITLKSRLTRLRAEGPIMDASIINDFLRHHPLPESWQYGFYPQWHLKVPSEQRLIEPLLEYTNQILNDGSNGVLVKYIWVSAALPSLPYLFLDTIRFLESGSNTEAPAQSPGRWAEAFLRIVERQQKEFNSQDPEWLDDLIRALMPSIPVLAESEITSHIIGGFTKYLAYRNSERALQSWAARSHNNLTVIWYGLVHSLPSAPSKVEAVLGRVQPPNRIETLRAIWRLASLYEAVRFGGCSWLYAIAEIENTEVSIFASVTAFIKIHNLALETMSKEERPNVTTSKLDEEDAQQTTMITVIADFLATAAHSDEPIYEAVKSFQLITRNAYPDDVHPTEQIRFTSAVAAVFSCGHCGNLRAPLLYCPLLRIYTGSSYATDNFWLPNHPPGDPRRPWLDHSPARKTIRDTFSAYAEELSTEDPESDNLVQVRAVLEGFERLHPTSEENYDGV
ncbi:hypothetical protein C8R46DRAFT_1301743 [Mycena filopes]|nr:hypothetical protein C8R46DRAFT_1301743 [Mycena filopes]